MDFYRNVSEYQQEQVLSPTCSKAKLGALTTTTTAASLDDIFPAQNTEVDVSLEWLSVFVEDCLTSTGNSLPVAATTSVQTTISTTPKPTKPLHPQNPPPSLHKFLVPSKARTKRKRTTMGTTKTNPLTSWSKHLNPHYQNLNLTSSDPPLLQQAYWLADSELIVTKKEDTTTTNNNNKTKVKEEPKEEEFEVIAKENMITLEGGNGGGQLQQQPRRCTHCLSQRTPQWRAGPLGPKTLCNACGVRYKSGRLLPEYRPAKSPTFVSYLHSNSHKKVMEMRSGFAVFHSQ
ncbi:GATA domain-containing protein [Cephalotus follicularis]|uniref:GATA domain-containing protein n=1 Tax=Cephalotus follicularis TaxID=3775 RepID=A0A1Q3BXI5_CEPFO|nr:GATA domain-containing protein [Cephalotus follicularis]